MSPPEMTTRRTDHEPGYTTAIARPGERSRETPPSSRRGRPAPPARERSDEYVAFGNVQTRNDLQSRVEIPLMLRMLRPPPGGRVLEIGCGRGVALPVLADLLAPSALVGVDLDPVLIAAADRRVRASLISARVM